MKMHQIENCMILSSIDHLIEQFNKKQYMNCLAVLNELQMLILKRFNDVLKDHDSDENFIRKNP